MQKNEQLVITIAVKKCTAVTQITLSYRQFHFATQIQERNDNIFIKIINIKTF